MTAQQKPPELAGSRGQEIYQNRRRQFTPFCPRQSRALAALLQGPVPREQMDRLAGCSNTPDLIASLRRRGLAIPCEKIRVIDRDGRTCWPGIYSLTPADRGAVARWLAGGCHG